MTDEVEPQAPPDEGDKKPAEKTYTQAEVDRLVDIQRRKLKPLNDELDVLKQGKDEELAAYESVIKKVVEGLLPEVAEPIQELIVDLPLLKQFEKLTDGKNNILYNKKEFPLKKPKATNEKEFIPTPVEKFT